jgi:5-methylcytosine-specific restriction enzyme A
MPFAPKPVSRPRPDRRPPSSERYSPNWGKIRRHYLISHPYCDACGTWHNLTVHHRDGVRSNNDWSNLQTLCKSDHMRLEAMKGGK